MLFFFLQTSFALTVPLGVGLDKLSLVTFSLSAFLRFLLFPVNAAVTFGRLTSYMINLLLTCEGLEHGNGRASRSLLVNHSISLL